VFLGGQRHLQGHAEPRDPDRLREKIGPLSREGLIYAGGVAGVVLIWQLIQRTWTVQGAMHLVTAVMVLWFAWFLVTQCTREERGRMLSLVGLILFALVFYTLYEQTYGSWVAFSDRLMTKNLLGFEMTAGALTFLGSFFIVALSPLFAWLWPWLERRGRNPGTAMKTVLGLLFGGLAYLPLVVAAGVAAGGTAASVWWLVLAYFILEIGEVCLYPIGISAVTQLSVARVVSLMMGVWFLGTAYSEILAHSVFGKLSSLEPGTTASVAESAGKYGDLFLLMFWIGLGTTVLALACAPLLRRGMHGVR